MPNKDYKEITTYKTVSQIYNEVYNKELDMKVLDEKYKKKSIY